MSKNKDKDKAILAKSTLRVQEGEDSMKQTEEDLKKQDPERERATAILKEASVDASGTERSGV